MRSDLCSLTFNTTGQPMHMHTPSGNEVIERGMLPFSRCSSWHAPRGTGAEGNLGLPCTLGGSVARAQTDRHGTLIVSMQFFLPNSVAAPSGGGGAGECPPDTTWQRPPSYRIDR